MPKNVVVAMIVPFGIADSNIKRLRIPLSKLDKVKIKVLGRGCNCDTKI
jgi:hypothetical protein